MAKFQPDPHFKSFARSLQDLLVGEGFGDEDFTKKQKEQVENLVKLEKNFKKVLLNDSRGHLVYRKFIAFIWSSGKNSKRNTLVARPYFRERQSAFSKGISPAIQAKNFKKLYKYDINYLFISFALDAIPWGNNSKIRKAAKEVCAAREAIIQQNMPLAISRARIFRQKTPDAHLTYMDFVQISMEGLINAVDKFVLPYTPVFRSVIIGRIVGDLIENYSDKMLHFYPSDKRKIYRANKAQKNKELDFEKLSTLVNSGTELDNPTNPSEIQHLMAASSHFSLDSPAPEIDQKGEEGDTLIERYADEDGARPDHIFESNQLLEILSKEISKLSVFEQKFIRLKGVEV